ncbi:alpha/beta hydrolase [Pseudorhodoplanes sinuspersici]|uniref:Alpha/beta hydrolase fold-3 domain-containing protein n=1 Tax=Pseudorhodoplanes sinuspersici TaxID=1235591 RepID=A0A1W6ZNT3_9HYPH|nr:hypothetical protein CAK95_04560 [Pseudorhodoplanes sinuspersici]
MQRSLACYVTDNGKSTDLSGSGARIANIGRPNRHRNCSAFGGDAGRLYVVGHSSGAHLAAMALSTRWADYGLPTKPSRGGVLVSGIYDLGPLRHTSRSKYVRIDDRAERQLSPLHEIASLTAPLLLAVGSTESPEFRRQARDYAKAVAQSGKQATVIVGESYNHFDILETIGSPYGLLGRTLLDFVRLDMHEGHAI